MSDTPVEITLNALVRRLRKLTHLAEPELAALGQLISEPRSLPSGARLAREGEQTDDIYVLLEGWAARAKLLPGGRRQLSLVLLPGEFCNLDALHVQRLDYTVETLSPCSVASISRAGLLDLTRRFPAIGEVLTWLAFVENAIMTEWLASLGHRSANQRLGRLLCEFGARLSAVGLAERNGYALPMNQVMLADAVGLTTVHVNRALQSLRSSEAIMLDEDRLTIRDPDALERESEFTPHYLHLDGMRSQEGRH